MRSPALSRIKAASNSRARLCRQATRRAGSRAASARSRKDRRRESARVDVVDRRERSARRSAAAAVVPRHQPQPRGRARAREVDRRNALTCARPRSRRASRRFRAAINKRSSSVARSHTIRNSCSYTSRRAGSTSVPRRSCSRVLIEARNAGVAVLLISFELDEILALLRSRPRHGIAVPSSATSLAERSTADASARSWRVQRARSCVVMWRCRG